MPPTVCALTMVRDDYVFFQVWMRHYSKMLGKDKLYVIVHGNDEKILELAQGTNLLRVPAAELETVTTPAFDRKRFFLINGLANGLSKYFDHVIVTDSDELLVVDPALDQSIFEYLEVHKSASTITAIGLNIFQKISEEKNRLDTQLSLLRQRSYCQLEPLNCKPIITNRQIRRSEGNHATDDPNLYIGDGLFLFHLKFVDKELTIETVKSRHCAAGLLGPSFTREDNEMKLAKIHDEISERYRMFDGLSLADASFNFERDVEAFYRTWRRRRYWLQGDYWKSLFEGDDIGYSKHYRFNLFESPCYHKIPERFSDCILGA